MPAIPPVRQITITRFCCQNLSRRWLRVNESENEQTLSPSVFPRLLDFNLQQHDANERAMVLAWLRPYLTDGGIRATLTQVE
jgi:hypothetical protein